MAMRLVSIWIIFVSTILNISNGFYLSTHALEWINASNYCLSYCNSHLASIHSASDHLKTLDIIDRNPNIYTRVWLGLNDIVRSDHWEWSDGSPLDFGGSINTDGLLIKGQYPWRGDEPDFNDSDQCVALEVGSNYIGSNSLSWVDRKLTANYHFICNECSSKIHKYAAVNGARNYTEAEEICNLKFGTTLASIHSDFDMMEARMVCKQLTSSNGCWLGLTEFNHDRIYSWSDGTPFDYGNILHEYPWYLSEPGVTSDQPCTFLDPSNGADPGEYLWDDYWCHLKRPRALCNAPSQICYPTQFSIIKGNAAAWIYSEKPCEMSKTVLETESIALLANKQYLNSAGVLIIDMMYSITSVGLHGNAGIALYFDKNNCNNYYYIGIWGGHNIIFLGKHFNNEWNLITHTTLTEYALNTQYTLSIKLNLGTEWNVYLNDELMLAVSDNQFDNQNNKLSGYIAIRNVNAAINIKSLYISGDVQYEDNNIWHHQCTGKPTTAPTLNTLSPTTTNPTLTPSKTPTNYPTENPSGSPTMEPTLLPSKYPTHNTNNPSEYPTKKPSQIPTLEPTLEPTNKITLGPTFRPTIQTTLEPTNKITLGPTFRPTIQTTFRPIIQTTNKITLGPTASPTLNPAKSPTFRPIIQTTRNIPSTNSPTKTITNTPTKTVTNRRTMIPTLNPTIQNISSIMYEKVYIKQNRNQLIWVIGIPIGFMFFCVFGVYLLYNYYLETNEEEEKNNKLELERIKSVNNEMGNTNNNNNETNENIEDDNDSSEKNLLIGSCNNSDDIPNGIDDENGELNAPMNTNDIESDNEYEYKQGETEIENESDYDESDYGESDDGENESDDGENDNDVKLEMVIHENKNKNESENENDEKCDGDNEDDMSDYNLETVPLNYRLKPGYKKKT